MQNPQFKLQTMQLKFRDCQYKMVHCSESKGQPNGTIKNNYFHPWSAQIISLVQVRNSLMKREDEADAEKKKLQNRCNNLEEKSVMLHSENVRHKSCSFNLKPNLERRSGKTRGGAVPCEEWNWGDEAGIAGEIMSHVHPRILIHMLYQPRLLRYAGHMFLPNFIFTPTFCLQIPSLLRWTEVPNREPSEVTASVRGWWAGARVWKNPELKQLLRRLTL